MKTRNKFSHPQFKKAWNLIDQSQNIFLTTHEGTDGDDLGSLLAVQAALTSKGKKTTAAVKGNIPLTLKFLPGAGKVGDAFVNKDFDLIITFGCSKIERPGFKELKTVKAPIINFDHHPDNSHFGHINIVVPKTAAVAELVYYFLQSAEVEINKDMATALLTGIFSDTGGFKHSNTSAEVFEVAAQLLKKGARIDKISSYTFGHKRPQAIRAWSKALENARLDVKKKLAFSVMTEEDFAELGATEEDLQGFVEMLNNIPQAKFALLLRQDGGVIKGSLRSEEHKGVDVSAIAHSFGGGGHKLAAGFKVDGKLIKNKNSWKIK
jgi:bifunctional oligoribonuclease and PAP phosphatase NrnA